MMGAREEQELAKSWSRIEREKKVAEREQMKLDAELKNQIQSESRTRHTK